MQSSSKTVQTVKQENIVIKHDLNVVISSDVAARFEHAGANLRKPYQAGMTDTWAEELAAAGCELEAFASASRKGILSRGMAYDYLNRSACHLGKASSAISQLPASIATPKVRSILTTSFRVVGETIRAIRAPKSWTSDANYQAGQAFEDASELVVTPDFKVEDLRAKLNVASLVFSTIAANLNRPQGEVCEEFSTNEAPVN